MVGLLLLVRGTVRAGASYQVAEVSEVADDFIVGRGYAGLDSDDRRAPAGAVARFGLDSNITASPAEDEIFGHYRHNTFLMRVDEAYRILDLQPGASEEEVR